MSRKLLKDPLSSLSLSSVEVPDVRYKADMDLHDRFQQFGAEVLRLASLGLAGFGFVLVTESSKTTIAIAAMKTDLTLRWLIGLSPLCFGVCIALALVHRFLASDGMFHHLRAIKLLIVHKERSSAAVEEQTDEVLKEETARNIKFAWSEYFLYFAAGFLFLGAAFLASSFIRTIYLLPR